ncbi:hypothetical protein OE88DRAFT_1659473 [Heliocybe sulcata]|uniref:Uncharacterized protein n=1 Tax=Heliocybe sulcata TaxID=5364 RepID=A0A5C3N115_9AGAM|nr:hypothetical protein OE88DRAFT_1659473 [Heliocybe sulcata]
MVFDMFLALIVAAAIVCIALVGLGYFFRSSVVLSRISVFVVSIATRVSAMRGSVSDASIATWWNRDSIHSELPSTSAISILNRQSTEGGALLERIKQTALDILPTTPDLLLTSPSGNTLPLPTVTPPNPEVITVDESRIQQPTLLNVYWLPLLLNCIHHHVSNSDNGTYDTVEPGSPVTPDIERQEGDISSYDSIAASIGASFMSSDSSTSVFTPAGSDLPTLVSQWTDPTSPATARATIANSDYQASLRTSRRWSYPLSQPEATRRAAILDPEYQASLKTSRRASLPTPHRRPDYQHGRSFSMPVDIYAPTVDWTKRKTADETKNELLVALGLVAPTTPSTDQSLSTLTPSATSPAAFAGSVSIDTPPMVLEAPTDAPSVEDVPVLVEESSVPILPSPTLDDDTSVSTSTSSGFDNSSTSVASSSSATSCSSSSDIVEPLPAPSPLPEPAVQKSKPAPAEKGKKRTVPSNAKVWSPSASWSVRPKTPIEPDTRKPAVPTKDAKASKPVKVVKKQVKTTVTKPTKTEDVKAVKRVDASKPPATSKAPVVERKQVGVAARRNSTAKATAGTWR